MFKRILTAILVVVLGVSLFMSYRFLTKEAQKNMEPIVAIPLDVGIVIESNNIRNVWTNLTETNLVFSELMNVPEMITFKNTIARIDSTVNTYPSLSVIFDNKPVGIGFFKNENLDFFIATQCSEKQFEDVQSLINNSTTIKQNKIVNEVVVHQCNLGGREYFFALKTPLILFSSNATLIQKSILQLETKKSLLSDSDFTSLRLTNSKTAFAHIHIQSPQIGTLLSSYLTKRMSEDIYNGKVLPKWTTFDLSAKSNSLTVSGLSTSEVDNKKKKNTLLQAPSATNSMRFLPKEVKTFKRTSISDVPIFIEQNNLANISTVSQSCNCDVLTSFSDWIGEEILDITFGSKNEQLIYVASDGYPNLLGKLSSFGVSDTIVIKTLGVASYLLESDDVLNLLGVKYQANKKVYFLQKEGYAVFGSRSALQKIIYEWNAHKSTVVSSDFTKFSEKLMANYSNIDLYWTLDQLLESATEIIKPEYLDRLTNLKNELSQLNAMIYQASATKNDFIYHSLAVNTKNGNEQTGAVTTLWKLKLQDQIILAPQLMKNHRTNTLEIVTQDEKYNLHLISATGKVKWSRPIKEPIIGGITQIDIYGNNKYQMLFNTANKIHLIDINGNEVKGYPVTLKEAASNQVMALDYENNYNYRLVLATTSQRILNYSKDGKPVEGWKAATTKSLITQPFAHFVTEGKDYIFNTDIQGNIYLLNRKGEIRHVVDSTFNTSQKDKVYLVKGNSIETSKVVFVDSSAQFSSLFFDNTIQKLNIDSSLFDYNYYLTDLENDNLYEYVVMQPNKLSVYGPDKSMIFTEIYDFDVSRNVSSVGNKNKHTVIYNSLQDQILVYNHQFKLQQGFPLSGGKYNLSGDINKDGNNEIITVLNSNEFIVYTLNLFYGM